MTVIGKDCVLGYDAIANWASPSLAAVPNAVDVSQPGISKTAIDLPSRGTGGWNPKGAGLKSMDLSFGYLCDAGDDAVLNALRGSYINDTVMQFAVLDGPIAGIAGRVVQGFRFPGIVMEFPIDEQLEDGRRIEIKVEFARHKLAGVLLLPVWMVLTAL